MAEPHLYRKMKNILEQYGQLNQDYEISRENVKAVLSRKFRISREDARIVMKELEDSNRARGNKKKIRFL